jgi:hypothetical protein
MGTKNSKTPQTPSLSNARIADDDVRVSKLLILGAGNQGKSLVFEQLKYLMRKENGEKGDILDHEASKAQIVRFATDNLKALLAQLDNHVKQGVPLSSAEPLDVLKLTPEAQSAHDELFSNDSKASVDNLADFVDVLWKDPGVQRIFKFVVKECKMELSEHLEYVLDNFQVLMEPGNALLNRELLLKAMPPTSGIQEYKSSTKYRAESHMHSLVGPSSDFIEPERKHHILIVSVGGIRKERKVHVEIIVIDLLTFICVLSEVDPYF